MPHIIALKRIRRRGNLIIVLIIGYNDHYINFKEAIIEILFFYKHITLKEYKFTTLKNYLNTIFAQQ
jgi:hypothetical protein